MISMNASIWAPEFLTVLKGKAEPVPKRQELPAQETIEQRESRVSLLGVKPEHEAPCHSI
jgi:hypothetical protein